MPLSLQNSTPTCSKQLNFEPYGKVTPSPSDWWDQFFYFLLPDRFSNGQEAPNTLLI